MSRDSETVVLPENFSVDEYSIFVWHQERWVRAATSNCLDRAEEMAEGAHRRSNFRVEVRDSCGTVVASFDPPAPSSSRSRTAVEFVQI